MSENFLTGREELPEIEQLSRADPAGQGRGRAWINYVFTPVLNGRGAIFIGVISVIVALFFWVDGTTVINEGLLRKTYGVVVVDPSPPSRNVVVHPTPNPSELGHHKYIIKNKRREHRRKDAGEGPISRFVSIMGFTEDDKPLISLLFSIPRISFLFGIFFSFYRGIRLAWGTLRFAYRAYDAGRIALRHANRMGQNIQGIVTPGVDRGRGPGRTLSVLRSRSFLIGMISAVLLIASFYVDSTSIITEGLLTKDVAYPTPNPSSDSVSGKGVASTQADDHVVVGQIDGSQITKLTDDDGIVVGKEAITKQVDNRVVTKPTDHDGVVTNQGVIGGA